VRRGIEGGGEEAGDADAGGEPADVAGVAGLLEEGSEFFVSGEAFGLEELQDGGGLGVERFKRGEDFGEDVLDDLFVHICSSWLNLVHAGSSNFYARFQRLWLRGELAAKLLEFAGEFGFAEVELVDGDTGFPGFFDAHEGECSAGEGRVLHEVDHVLHALVGIFHAPEVVHDGGDSGEEAENGHGTEFGLDAEQNAGAADDERDG